MKYIENETNLYIYIYIHNFLICYEVEKIIVYVCFK